MKALLPVLKELAEAKATTPAAIALRYLMAKGALPIPGAKNEAQARQNALALTLRLTPEEVARLEAS